MERVKLAVVIGMVLLGGFALAQKDKAAAPRPPAPPPLPPSTEELLTATPESAAWVDGEKAGMGKGVKIALVGQDPTTTGQTVYLKLAPGAKVALHWHTHTQDVIMLAGKGQLTLDGKPFKLQPGAFAVVPSKLEHDLSCDKGAECLVLQRYHGPRDTIWAEPHAAQATGK